MSKEIERKFLVSYLPVDEPVEERNYVFQGYLKVGKDHEVRISNRLHLTVKTGHGLVREETIINITPEVYEALLPLTVGRQIQKARYWYDIGGGLKAELDIYKGKNEGIRTVEVEFPDEEAARSFVPPDWFGEDVSDRLEYKNSLLAK